MKRKEIFLLLFFIVIIVSIFFYKTVFLRQIPFPGDLLVNDVPYKTQSYLGYAPGGYPNKAQGRDVIYEMYPWKHFAISQMKNGRIPFWNPHNFSGNLQMQNFQTAIFYPLNIVFFLLPFNSGWSFLILSQPLLAMIFMYLFLKDYKLHPIACLAGSIAFAFSSYMTVWMEYGNIGNTIVWLPLILFLIKRFIAKQTVSNFIFLVLSLTVSILAGYIQGVFYIYILAIAYAVYVTFVTKKEFTLRFLFSLFLIFLLPILLSSFQLLPTFEFFRTSTRNPYSLTQIQNLLQPVYYWVTIFVPDFFGNPAARNYFLPITYIERVMYAGVPILLFAFLGIRRKHPHKKYFLTVALLVLLLTTNIPGVAYFYQIPIPVLSTTVPTRALSMFIFSIIILAAFGIDDWIKSREKRYILPIVFLSLYALFWVSVFILPKFFPLLLANTSVVKHNLLFSTILAIGSVGIFSLKEKFHRAGVFFLLALIIFDLFYFFNKITPFSPEQLIYPSTPVISYLEKHAGINRFWGYGKAYISPNFQSVDQTYSPEGNDPLHLKDYGILLASTKDGNYPQLLPRPDANIAPGYGESDLKNNIYRQKILNLLGVKYVLHLTDGASADYAVFPKETYQLIWQQNPWQIYENKQVLPRFFIASDYTVLKDKKNILRAVYNRDLSKTIILEEPLKIKIQPEATGKAELIKYQPIHVSIKTTTTNNALLFLSDNYYHSWDALVDGKQVLLHKADFTFRAVEVPKGTHTVTFVYNSYYFKIGLYTATGGLLVFLFYSFYLLKKKHP